MDDQGFKQWLLSAGREPGAAEHRVSVLLKIEKNLAGLGVPFPDLDTAYEADRLESVIAAVRHLADDHKAGGQAYRLLMPDSENPRNRLGNLATYLGRYRAYKSGDGAERDADRIREHALETYIIPGRDQGQSLTTINIKAVNDALGLNKGWPNIQQALTGPLFLKMAEVQSPIRKGPRQSTTTNFTFYLESGNLTLDVVREVLELQFGSPITSTQKIFAVQATDGRQIAMDSEVRGAPLLWVEAELPLPAGVEVKRHYAQDEPRHSGLPPRLRAGGNEARAVAVCPTATWDALSRLVEHHAESEAQMAVPQAQSTGTLAQSLGPTNLILYGPPGTGKTYATTVEAVRLCSPTFDLGDRGLVEAEYRRLLDAGRVEFVTFHQSYSYEDFVEGLRPPVSGKDDESDDAKSGFRLEVSPGIFHRVATRAAASRGSGGKPFDLTGRQVFKMSIGEAANPDEAYLFEDALAAGYALLGFGTIDWTNDRFANRQSIIDEWREIEGDIDEPATAQSARVKCHDAFRNSLKIGDLLIVSKGNGSFRAIGEVVGPYEFAPREDGGYPHRRKVNWLWQDRDGVPVEDILTKRFSMLTLYRIAQADLNLSALQRYITQEPIGPPEQFVLIIDEINRANISKVFGELITLLEGDKRTTPNGGGLRIRLPYSKQLFGVPANLHVIGTMNTADRSIALLDTALRRRFEFRELMPKPHLPALAEASKKSSVDLGKLLTSMNDRIEYLFDREHQIGHAYFIKCASKADVDDVMRHKVIPLLTEYFYEDWTKVALVLGDAAGAGNFLQRTELKPPSILEDDVREVRYRWSLRDTFAPDAYAAFG